MVYLNILLIVIKYIIAAYLLDINLIYNLITMYSKYVNKCFNLVFVYDLFSKYIILCIWINVCKLIK